MGPMASVLLTKQIKRKSQEQVELHKLIDSISSERRPSKIYDKTRVVCDTGANEGFDFLVSNAKTIKGNYQGPGRPFSIDLYHPPEQYPEYDDQDRKTIEYFFDLTLSGQINIHAKCNQEVDHKILGQLALAIVEKYGGLIDFGGALSCVENNLYELKQPWEDMEPYFCKLPDEFSGLLLSIPYWIVPGERTWLFHIGDVEFLEIWLNHPRFRMIK